MTSKASDFRFNEESVRRISLLKKEPEWMRELRLKAWRYFKRLPDPELLPELKSLDYASLFSFVESQQKEFVENWEDLPQEIRDSFRGLRKRGDLLQETAAIGAQYDSKMVLHTLSQAAAQSGIVYLSMEEALRNADYSQLLQKYFMKLIAIDEHKFTALHTALWSGGSFVYVPKYAKLRLPLQAYCRFEKAGAGQFGHTVIVLDEGAEAEFIEACSAPEHPIQSIHAACVEIFVGKNAKLKYSAIENWPHNIFNLNTKRAIVEEGGLIEWVSANFGSSLNVMYPSTILAATNAKMEMNSISVADRDQSYDSGMKVFFKANNCSAHIYSKSIAMRGGKNCFRGNISCDAGVVGCESFLNCDSLILDEDSCAEAYPVYDIRSHKNSFSHEAKIGKISQEKLESLEARGLSEDNARKLILRGFAASVSDELPRGYKKEIARLIK